MIIKNISKETSKLFGPWIICKLRGENWNIIGESIGGIFYEEWSSFSKAKKALERILEDPKSGHAVSGKYGIMEKCWDLKMTRHGE